MVESGCLDLNVLVIPYTACLYLPPIVYTLKAVQGWLLTSVRYSEGMATCIFGSYFSLDNLSSESIFGAPASKNTYEGSDYGLNYGIDFLPR
jgi:hypothetical protein